MFRISLGVSLCLAFCARLQAAPGLSLEMGQAAQRIVVNGDQTATITIRLTKPAAGAVTADLAVSGDATGMDTPAYRGTVTGAIPAVCGPAYTLTPRQVAFAAGETSKTVTLTVRDRKTADGLHIPDVPRTLTISLANFVPAEAAKSFAANAVSVEVVDGVVRPNGAETFFGVTNFGAVGDGKSDDTQAIQAAIDAAAKVIRPKPANPNDQAIVYFPGHKTYMVGPSAAHAAYCLILRDGVCLVGQDKSAVIKRFGEDWMVENKLHETAALQYDGRWQVDLIANNVYAGATDSSLMTLKNLTVDGNLAECYQDAAGIPPNGVYAVNWPYKPDPYLDTIKKSLSEKLACVDATTFTVGFRFDRIMYAAGKDYPGVSVTIDCGADGVATGTVAKSSFADGKTTVVLEGLNGKITDKIASISWVCRPRPIPSFAGIRWEGSHSYWVQNAGSAIAGKVRTLVEDVLFEGADGGAIGVNYNADVKVYNTKLNNVYDFKTAYIPVGGNTVHHLAQCTFDGTITSGGIHMEVNGASNGFHKDSRVNLLVEDTFVRGSLDIELMCQTESTLALKRVKQVKNRFCMNGAINAGPAKIIGEDCDLVFGRLGGAGTRNTRINASYTRCNFLAADVGTGAPCAGPGLKQVGDYAGAYSCTFTDCTFGKLDPFPGEEVYADYPLGATRNCVAAYKGCTFNTDIGPSNCGFAAYSAPLGGKIVVDGCTFNNAKYCTKFMVRATDKDKVTGEIVYAGNNTFKNCDKLLFIFLSDAKYSAEGFYTGFSDWTFPATGANNTIDVLNASVLAGLRAIPADHFNGGNFPGRVLSGTGAPTVNAFPNDKYTDTVTGKTYRCTAAGANVGGVKQDSTWKEQ